MEIWAAVRPRRVPSTAGQRARAGETQAAAHGGLRRDISHYSAIMCRSVMRECSFFLSVLVSLRETVTVVWRLVSPESSSLVRLCFHFSGPVGHSKQAE